MSGFTDKVRAMVNDPANRAKVQRAVRTVQEQARKPENREKLVTLRNRVMNNRGRRSY
jgi:hypothetical protein